jgi:hypothetical protein
MLRLYYIGSVFVGLVAYLFRYYGEKKRLLFAISCKALVTNVLPNKIERRYRKYIPVFLGIEYMYGLLVGQKLDADQRRNSTLLCGITPMFDDMIDDHNHTTASIMPLVRGTVQPYEPEARCAIALYREGRFEWNHLWDHTLAVQTESIHQLTHQLTPDELLRLTCDKGGVSVVYGWHVITREHGGRPVADAAYALGAYAQIVNDIFDVYQDREAGIATLATRCTNVAHLQKTHQDLYQKMELALEHVPVPKANIRKLKAMFALLRAMGNVALLQLWEAQQRTMGQPFDVHRLERRDLVCDLSLWRNRWRWATRVLGNQTT